MAAAPLQLSLGISLMDDATFENFYAADTAAAEVVASLRALAEGREQSSHVIWGAPGCGITHLLQAACHHAHAAGRTVQYLPVRYVRGYAADDICEGLEATQLVCLDGLELICGDKTWEQALFHLFNRLRDAGHGLLLAAHTSPAALPLVLPDLKSRVLGSMVYHVASLSDDDKQAALIMRAAARGLQMPTDVAKYILNRSSRDMNDLFVLLNRLDESSMQQQRKLTIPFVKEVLGTPLPGQNKSY